MASSSFERADAPWADPVMTRAEMVALFATEPVDFDERGDILRGLLDQERAAVAGPLTGGHGEAASA